MATVVIKPGEEIKADYTGVEPQPKVKFETDSVGRRYATLTINETVLGTTGTPVFTPQPIVLKFGTRALERFCLEILNQINPVTAEIVVGQRWKYQADKKKSLTYEITFVGDDYLTLLGVEDSWQMPNYSKEMFLTGIANGTWIQDMSNLCAKCEVNQKAEDDYICSDCRFGPTS